MTKDGTGNKGGTLVTKDDTGDKAGTLKDGIGYKGVAEMADLRDGKGSYQRQSSFWTAWWAPTSATLT